MIIVHSQLCFNEEDMLRLCAKHSMSRWRVLGVVATTIEISETIGRHANQEWFEHTLDEACHILSENPLIGLGQSNFSN